MSRESAKRKAIERAQKKIDDAKALEKAKAQAKLDAILNSIKTEEGRAKILEDIKNYVASNKDLSLDDMYNSLEYYTRIIIDHDPHSSGADFKANTLFDEDHSNLSPMTKTILTMIANVIEKNGRDATGKERTQLKHLENGLRKLNKSVEEEADKDQAAKDQAAKDQAAKDQAAKDQADKDQAAKDQAAKDQAAKDQAAKDQAAKDQAAKDQAAKDQAAADKLQESKDSSIDSLSKIGNILVNDSSKETNVFKDYCTIVKMQDECDESLNIYLENNSEDAPSFCCPFTAHEEYKSAAADLLGEPTDNSSTEL